MIDLTNLKAPGWQAVVAELSAGAPDDKVFFERLMRVLAQVSAARQTTLYLPSRTDGEEVEARAVSTWPASPVLEPVADDAASGGEIEAEARSAARAAFESGAPRAFGLDKQAQYYDSSPGKGYLLSIPLVTRPAVPGPPGQPAQAAAVAAVVVMRIEPRSREAVRSTLAMAEVLAGYVGAHATRQQLRRMQAAGFALDLATRLIASINTAPSFRGSVLQLVNDLSRQFGVERVALGWVRGWDQTGDAVRVEAISDTEHFDRRMAMVQRLQGAMEECLDQEQPVMFPQPPAEGPGADVLLSQAIVQAHRELAAGDNKLKVCSIPLRVDETVVGVVTIESAAEGPIDLGTIELIQAALDLVAPVLRIRRSDDRNLALRAWDSTVKGAAWAVGSKHTVWKGAGILALAAIVFVSVYHTSYRVGADAVLQPRVKRTVSAPFNGVIKRLGEGIHPGKVVKEGDLLAELDSTESALSAADARSKLNQAIKQAEKARNDGKADEAAIAETQAERAQAELSVHEYRVQRARIVAPISGTVIAGDLKDRVDAAVKLGDSLFEIAQMDSVLCIAQVDDRDISLLKQAIADGNGVAVGVIVTKSHPAIAHDLVVEQVVPLATAKEGKNTFEVRARVENPAEWMTPGMEGLAKFRTQRHSLLWIGSRRIVDTIRLWLW